MALGSEQTCSMDLKLILASRPGYHNLSVSARREKKTFLIDLEWYLLCIQPEIMQKKTIWKAFQLKVMGSKKQFKIR